MIDMTFFFCVSFPGGTLRWHIWHPHGSAPFEINLKCISAADRDRILSVTIAATDTIKDVKDRIAEQHQIASANQRILFAGCALEDGRTIDSYKARRARREGT